MPLTRLQQLQLDAYKRELVRKKLEAENKQRATALLNQMIRTVQANTVFSTHVGKDNYE